MMDDDPFDFRPRLGRVRNRDGRGSDSRSFLTQVMRAATEANGGPLKLARMRGERRSSARKWPRKGRCSRIGRGQMAADRLKLMAAGRRPTERMRRVVVKARIVRLRVASRAADAHVGYLQRDGTTRDGEHARLYGAGTDAADGRGFTERGRDDRHQFRFIVAPEDGDRLSDLRGFTRDVLRGHASRTPQGRLRVKADLIATLARQEVERVGRQLAAERGLAFQAIHEGQTVRGKLLGSAQLASGRFAMIDDGLGFNLVPWRPILEKEIGRQVMGVVRGGDISWQLGRAIGLGIGF